MGAEQEQTRKKSHIKQLSVHFVFIAEIVADKENLDLEKTLSSKVFEWFSPVYLCWSLSSLRSSRGKVRLCLPDGQQGNPRPE